MSLGQVLVAMTLTTVVGRKVLKTNETETVFAGITCYGDQLPDGKMCSSVSNMLKCPNTFAKVDSGAFVQCEVVDGQCLTTGGQKQKLCHLPTCDDSLAIDMSRNLVEGVVPKVSSECYKRNPTNKGYLTDGDTRARGRGDRKYWHSCRDNKPNAEVSFPLKCVREVKIWSRADCCAHQMQGVVAEVWSDGKWKRCGGTSGNVGTKNFYSFKCAMYGTKVRIIKHKNNAWITTSELQVFGAINPHLPIKQCTAALRPGKMNLVAGLTPRVSSDCFTPARHQKFLTDGDTREGNNRNDHYWHSCHQRNNWAEVSFPETCIRQVKIWSRPNCCPNQMQGVIAEVWSGGKWQRCGAPSPNVHKHSAPYAFDCAMVGSKVRVSRGHKRHGRWFTISELQVFGPSLDPVCEATMGVDKTKNLAFGVNPRVSSDCYKNARHKKFLTDGDRRIGKRGNHHYWHSCNQRNKWAEVDIPEQCVRQVQIWSRPNCCPNQIQGVVAEVWSEGKWQRCGGKSPNIGKKSAPYAFDCGIVGSKVRISRNHHAWFTVSELEVFGPSQEPQCSLSMGISKTNVALRAPTRVSSDCYKNARHKKFLTDGDRRIGKRGNDHYWHSCNQRKKWAEVTIPEQCVRQVQIWSRPNCCPNQIQGVVAEVWSDGKWKRCGGTSPNIGKKSAPYAFDAGHGVMTALKRNGRGDRNYWHSCREKNPRAEVAFPKQCIREVKIWSRADCCSHQMQGVIAEIWSDGQWKRCGGTSGNVGKKNSYSFKCSIVGSKARIIKKKNRAWITTSELEVFGAATKKKKEPKCDSSMSISNKNFARGLRAKVSSECYKRNPTNKGYLTDGDNRKRGQQPQR
eukprot:s2293_g17.t1